MPTEPHTPTLAEVVRTAADAVDPTGTDEGVVELLRRFEDRDEPVTTVTDVEEQLSEARRAVDVEGDSPALADTVQVATYLAFRRDQLGADADELVRRARAAEDAG